MQDTELFMELAGIAGVFVGFGALIAVRSGGASDPHEVAYMRAVVWMGLMAVVAALAPVTIGRYGLAEHQVWALSSVLVFVGYFGMVAVATRQPEVTAAQAARSRTYRLVEDGGTLLWAIATIAALGAIVLGLVPELEAALYFTVVVLIMLGAGFTLLELAFSQRGPATT